VRLVHDVAGHNISTLQQLNRSTSSFSFSAFETRSLPALTRSYPRRFTFYVTHPDRSIQLSAFA
jgi:hypothetical protein